MYAPCAGPCPWLLTRHRFDLSELAYYFLNSLPFFKFATNEAIQRTEAYEYAQSLGAHACTLPSFQVSSARSLGAHACAPPSFQVGLAKHQGRSWECQPDAVDL